MKVKDNNANNPKPKVMKNDFKNFIWWGASLFPGLIILNLILFKFLFAPKEVFFFNLAASIILSWVLILILYYVWAIYFYNINLGWTDKDWQDHETKILVEGTPSEPKANPNLVETLGLPPGTVRGTIALSVIVGGMAMLIASLAMPGRLSQNEFLVDHFEFLKTAFLMVIAFYFGTKSLELLKDKKPASGGDTAEEEKGSSSSTSFTKADQSATTTLRDVVGDISKGNKSAEDFHDPRAKG